MKRRYVTKNWYPTGDWEDYDRSASGAAHTVFEPDPSPIPTGLLDASGEPILAVDVMDPIGFIRFDEYE